MNSNRDLRKKLWVQEDNKDEKEDDEDFDVIIPQKFDLALRKFITQIDSNEVKDRIPQVNTTPLDDGKNTKK